MALPFGLRSAPYIFIAIADLVQWMLTHNYGVDFLRHYLDDFLTLGPPASPVCFNNLQACIQLCSKIGLLLHPEKLEGPSTCLSRLCMLMLLSVFFLFSVVAGTLDFYGNEGDFFLVLLRSYLTSTITTTCCLNTCPLQVYTIQSLSVILPQPSNNLNSNVFLDSLDDWQSPPDSNCGRKFATQPSGGIPFSEDVTIDEHGNANMSWHCAGVRVSSHRSMPNLKSFLVLSVDLLRDSEEHKCMCFC